MNIQFDNGSDSFSFPTAKYNTLITMICCGWRTDILFYIRRFFRTELQSHSLRMSTNQMKCSHNKESLSVNLKRRSHEEDSCFIPIAMIWAAGLAWPGPACAGRWRGLPGYSILKSPFSRTLGRPWAGPPGGGGAIGAKMQWCRKSLNPDRDADHRRNAMASEWGWRNSGKKLRKIYS